MNDGAVPDLTAIDPQELARDWITLWQSELAALATDREAQEAWQTCLAVWAGMAMSMTAMLPRGGPSGAPGGGRPADAARPAAAAAAPDARDAEIERLARHIAELERRLARLERGVE